MSDKIRPEDEDAVEGTPAPPHPWPDSAAVSREPARGSPFAWSDKLIDEALEAGPSRKAFDRCPKCYRQWHGLYDKESNCEGAAQ